MEPVNNVREAVMLPIAEIKVDLQNAKVHTDTQIDKIAASIDRFGFRDPVAVREDGVLLEGHGRLAAARKLGMLELPAFIIPLTGNDATMYAYLHNKLTLDTPIDNELAMRQVFAGDDPAEDAAAVGFSDSEVQLFRPDNTDTSKAYFGNTHNDTNISAIAQQARGRKMMLEFTSQPQYDAFVAFLIKLKVAMPGADHHAARMLAYVDKANELEG